MNALSVDRYDLIRAVQQGAGQPRPSMVMPFNDAPVAPPAPARPQPLAPGAVPPPLSWPEPLPPRPAAAASAP
jgi:general secretion pathway protein D